MTSARPRYALTSAAPQSLSVEQAETLGELLAMLDATSHKRIVLTGPAGSGKSALLGELTRSIARPRRTPSQRRVVCSTIDAAQLPPDMQPWQHLLTRVLEALYIQSPTKEIIALADELQELIKLQHTHGDSIAFAAAAFAHRFRSAFEALVTEVISRQNAVLLVAVDHLERADTEAVAQLIEATQYFLKAPACTVMLCVDAQWMTEHEAFERELLHWMTSRLEIRVRPTTPPAPKPRTERLPQSLMHMPALCAQILLDALGSNADALDRAGATWQASMDAFAQRDDDPPNSALVAKLCALRELSPQLMAAVGSDVGALLALERAARTETTPGDTSHPLIEMLREQPRAWALLRSAPGFAGTDPRHLAAALRYIGTPVPQKTQPHPAETIKMEAAFAPALDAPRLPHVTLPAGLWAFLSVGAGAFALDRFTKLGEGLAPAMTPSQPDLLLAGASIAADLIGIALLVLIIGFFNALNSPSRATAFGLLLAGLGANLLDRFVHGAAINWIALGNVVAFNIAHVSIAMGALLLLVNLIHSLSSAHE